MFQDTDTELDNNPVTPPPENRPKIKHLLMSGGGATGFAYYGVLRESHKEGFWNIKDIQSIHGVSCGALFAFIVLFISHFTWDELDDFMIKRPWEQIFNLSPDKLMCLYKNIGVFGKDTLVEIISPILNAVDLPINTTMQELYEFTGIEVHFYTTHLKRNVEYVDISYKTHPTWTVADALYSSCSLPILFCPNIIDGKTYIDGGIICNFPIQQCIDNGINPDEIFGIKKVYKLPDNMDINANPDVPYETVIDYLIDIVNKVTNRLFKEPSSKYTINIVDKTSAWEIWSVLKNRESRQQKIQCGVDHWKQFQSKRAT
jgi:NTE family protein